MFTALLALASLNAAMAGLALPELVRTVPEHVFIPPGFDDNDHVQITLSGVLQDTCHKVAPAGVRVDVPARRILIQEAAYYYPGCWCLYLVVPYYQTLNVGLLPAGNYNVFVETPEGGFRQIGTLPIARSDSAGQDDYLYAHVEDVTVSGRRQLALSGALMSDCLILKQVKTLHRNRNVIEILPIAEIAANTACKPSRRPFRIGVNLPSGLRGPILVHVRSLNGQSLNKVFQF